MIVCPAGFTKNAKARAQQLQIDLYSPVDTDPHKWQARLKAPAICDFREARISFGLSMSAPCPFMFPSDFMHSSRIMDAQSGKDLGTMISIASRQWNSGQYPIQVGEHEEIPILPMPVTMDNGYGQQVPVNVTVGLAVSRALFFGQFPITRLSGFHDAIGDGIITNAFEVGLLSLEEVHSWRRLSDLKEAPVKPVLHLRGLYGWSDD